MSSKEKMRAWRANLTEEKKAEIRQKDKEYKRKNFQVRDKKLFKKYREQNPEKFKISDWKRQGMKLREGEDWIDIYINYYLTENCENCNRILTEDKKITSTRKCLDHDHQTGFIRDVLCHACNYRRG